MYKSQKERYRPERQWPANSSDPFPMEGDILVLQFINTYRNRDRRDRKDLLGSYENFLAWCWEFGIIDLDHHNYLELEGRCYRDEANLVWQRAVRLREALHEFIYGPIRDREIHEIDMLIFNELVDEANAHLRYELDNNRPRQAFIDIEDQPKGPLLKLVKQAEYLLNSKAFDNIKKCKCGNVFLDTTHGKNRRWCNPLGCGQKARMRVYRKRIAERVTGEEATIMKIELIDSKCVGEVA
jgi:predicted RNA-binding Zn ribbon-like protein